MKKYIFLGIVFIAIVVFTLSNTRIEEAQSPELGGITRSVSYATSTVASTTASHVLAVNTRAKYRRVQQNSTSTLWCFASATSSATIQNNGIRLTQGESYEWSSHLNNLWPGAISCIAGATSTVLTEEHYE